MTWAYILAASLLTSPPEVLEPAIDRADWPAVQSALQATAIEWEILDPREARYILARPDDFQHDIGTLKHRFQELRLAPRLDNCQRFPDRLAINERLAFNRSYRKFLDSRQVLELDRSAGLRDAVRETDHLHRIWDAVRDAQCEYYYVPIRRQALARLRELIGAEAFSRGELPPCVPVWRFQDSH